MQNPHKVAVNRMSFHRDVFCSPEFTAEQRLTLSWGLGVEPDALGHTDKIGAFQTPRSAAGPNPREEPSTLRQQG